MVERVEKSGRIRSRIRGDRIRPLAERRGIRSAKELASKLAIRTEDGKMKPVSARTAARLWAGTVAPGFRAVSIDRLAEVLGVEAGVLTGELPIPSDPLNSIGKTARVDSYGRISIRANVDTLAANTLFLNAKRYKVSIRFQIELAPLLFHIVAQRSLRSRRQALEDYRKARAEFEAKTEGLAPHLYPALHAPSVSVEDAIRSEELSIEEEDLFATSDRFIGNTLSEEAEKRNPFAEEIRRLAQNILDIDAEAIFISNFGAGLSAEYQIQHRKEALEIAAGNEEIADAILRGLIGVQRLADLSEEERLPVLQQQYDKVKELLNEDGDII